MTTVLAVARDGVVYMAADSTTVIYDRPLAGAARKITRLAAGDSEVLVGLCGDMGLDGIVKYQMQVAQPPQPGEDPGRWAYSFAAGITELAVGAGLVEDGRLDGNLILGWGGHVWTISHANCAAHPDGIAAIGSGQGVAIGAVDALLSHNVDPDVAVWAALRIAIRRDIASDGPIQTEMLPAPGDQPYPGDGAGLC
jgi:ATP-dependent protease HslVU (ClpYQ) peptidase subunit